MILSLSLLLFVWKSVTPITLSFLILSGTLCASLRMKARQKDRKSVHGGLSSVRSNSQRACYGESIRGKDTAFENVRVTFQRISWATKSEFSIQLSLKKAFRSHPMGSFENFKIKIQKITLPRITRTTKDDALFA